LGEKKVGGRRKFEERQVEEASWSGKKAVSRERREGSKLEKRRHVERK